MSEPFIAKVNITELYNIVKEEEKLARQQYEKVVEQNKSLQKELRQTKKELEQRTEEVEMLLSHFNFSEIELMRQLKQCKRLLKHYEVKNDATKNN